MVSCSPSPLRSGTVNVMWLGSYWAELLTEVAKDKSDCIISVTRPASIVAEGVLLPSGTPVRAMRTAIGKPTMNIAKTPEPTTTSASEKPRRCPVAVAMISKLPQETGPIDKYRSHTFASFERPEMSGAVFRIVPSSGRVACQPWPVSSIIP